ncbi:MAG: hypothetical protein ACRDJM_10305, partial [Actinomycetota bacterium]
LEYQAMRTGVLDAAVAQQALLAAQAQAGAIRTGRGVYGRGWKELGPKPYHSDDGTYETSALGSSRSAQGMGIVSGRVSALALDPSDRTGSTAYVGTAGGGVWMTRNGGRSWTSIWDRMPTLAIGAIAVDPGRPKTIFVGTGEGAMASLTVFRGLGVYRSTDGGSTWSRTPRNVRGNVITHIEPAGRTIFVATDLGLWRSIDGGASYHDVRLPTNAAGTAPATGQWANVVTAVRGHPDEPSRVTAAVGWMGGTYGGPGNGLYRSTRGGAPGTWTRMNVDGLRFGSKSDDAIGRISLAYSTGPGQDHQVLWAVVQDAGLHRAELKNGVDAPLVPSVLNGVYRSGNDGDSWDLKATAETLSVAAGSALTAISAINAPGIQSWYNQWILVSPRDPNVVLVGLEEIYQTEANANGPGLAAWSTVGRYWNSCTFVAPVPCDAAPAGPYAGKTTHPDQHAAAFGLGGDRVWVGSDGGVWVQDSAAGRFVNDAWRNTNATLGTTQPYFATMAADGTVYLGLQDNGTGKITPRGYGVQVFGGDGGDVAVEPNDSDNVWEEYVYAAVSLSADGGKTWTGVTPTVDGAQFIAPFEMDPRNPNHVVLGARQIMETVEGMNTRCETDCDWMQSYDLGVNTTPRGNVNLSSSAIDVQGTVVYAGYCGPCLVPRQQRYDDSFIRSGIATNRRPGCTPATGLGACWHHATAKGLPNRFITDVEIDPRNPSMVFATLAGFQRRWIPPTSKAKGVGRGHVFMSRNAGESFVDITKNLPDVPAEAIVVKGDRLFVGTHMGVYTSVRPGAEWERLGTGLPA